MQILVPSLRAQRIKVGPCHVCTYSQPDPCRNLVSVKRVTVDCHKVNPSNCEVKQRSRKICDGHVMKGEFTGSKGGRDRGQNCPFCWLAWFDYEQKQSGRVQGRRCGSRVDFTPQTHHCTSGAILCKEEKAVGLKGQQWALPGACSFLSWCIALVPQGKGYQLGTLQVLLKIGLVTSRLNGQQAQTPTSATSGAILYTEENMGLKEKWWAAQACARKEFTSGSMHCICLTEKNSTNLVSYRFHPK